MRQQRTVDQVTRQVVVSHGGADRSVAVGGVGQRDAGSGAAEVAERHHAAGGQAGVGVQRGEGRRGVGHHRHAVGSRRPLGQHGQFAAQSGDGRGAPVRRIGDAGRFDRCAARGGCVGERAQRAGDQRLAAVKRPVGGHDADGVGGAVHEVGEDESSLERDRGLARQGREARDHGGDVRRAD